MSGLKVLIDTNVFIGLEDSKEVISDFSGFIRACGRHGVRVFVHERSVDDIKQDRNEERRKVSLSKIRKFESLSGIKQPNSFELEKRFGSINSPNDGVDVALLHAVDIGAVDFLITQDQGIHARSRKNASSLSNRVLTVEDAVAWLRTTYEPKEVRLPLVHEVPAHAIPSTDEIFESLREGYPEFDKWWREKCVANHRTCWVVSIDGELAGLVVRKDETHTEAGTYHHANKILKICTFKVKPQFRGEKLGELLLKQVLWFAQKNAYGLVYLTTFPDQIFLIRVLEYYGFQMTRTNDRGEQIFEKPLSETRLEANTEGSLFDVVRINYPRFVARSPAQAFCVPIKGEYHDILFPEMALKRQPDLFQLSGLQASGPRTPGNTIRKVYLCRARTKALTPGAILVFYRSKSKGYLTSQCATSIGVVEAVAHASHLDELVRLTAKRSVYSQAQLEEIMAASNEPVKVIDFLLVGHLDPPMTLEALKRMRVFEGQPPQSICALTPARFAPVRDHMKFGFEV